MQIHYFQNEIIKSSSESLFLYTKLKKRTSVCVCTTDKFAKRHFLINTQFVPIFKSESSGDAMDYTVWQQKNIYFCTNKSIRKELLAENMTSEHGVCFPSFCPAHASGIPVMFDPGLQTVEFCSVPVSSVQCSIKTNV